MFEWTTLIHTCKGCGASWAAPRDEPHKCVVEIMAAERDRLLAENAELRAQLGKLGSP